MSYLTLLAVVVFILGVRYFLNRLKESNDRMKLSTTSDKLVQSNESAGISIGLSPEYAAVKISFLDVLPDLSRVHKITPKSSSISQLSQILQLIPSVYVAGANSLDAGDGVLMRVVINGELVKASDGLGMRAFTKGFGEHAKLFQTNDPSNLINATALWQVASVVVAQKHLADISKKLDELKEGLDKVIAFQVKERRSVIEATYDYLCQARVAILQGELPKRVLHELERIEIDLNSKQRHLIADLKVASENVKETKHSEWFGTKKLTNDLSDRLQEIEPIAIDLLLCIKTRIAAWHVMSLFPGEQYFNQARHESIQQSLHNFKEQDAWNFISENIQKKINILDATMNFESTLQERRESLQRIFDDRKLHLFNGIDDALYVLEQTKDNLMLHDSPKSYIVRIVNGSVKDAYESDDA